MRLTIEDLQKAVNAAKKDGASDVQLLHNTIYFYPPAEDNKNAVTSLQDYLKKQGLTRYAAERKVWKKRLAGMESIQKDHTNFAPMMLRSMANIKDKIVELDQLEEGY